MFRPCLSALSLPIEKGPNRHETVRAFLNYVGPRVRDAPGRRQCWKDQQMQTYPTEAPPEYQPIKTGKRHKYRLPYGYRFPRCSDASPQPLPHARQFHTLYVDAMYRHGQPSWWQRSRSWANVHRFCVLKAHHPERRFDLDYKAVQVVATYVHANCCANLASGRTEQRFAEIQASRGRWSGFVRRERTADRDAGIVERIEAGESMRSVAADVGLSARAIHYIVHRWACYMNQSLNPGIQEDMVWKRTGLSFVPVGEDAGSESAPVKSAHKVEAPPPDYMVSIRNIEAALAVLRAEEKEGRKSFASSEMSRFHIPMPKDAGVLLAPQSLYQN